MSMTKMLLARQPKKTRTRHSKKTRKSSPLMVRLDRKSKSYLAQAAALRKISVSDYVREITVAQARREVVAAEGNTIILTREEQLAFWIALNEAPKLNEAQRRLGALMRGEC